MDKSSGFPHSDYDFYDDEDNHGQQIVSDLNNYTYSYQEYDNGTENESELDIVPELISQSRNIIVKAGDTVELPCKASVSKNQLLSYYFT